MNNTDILKRLYRDYTKRYIRKIFLSVFFTLILAGSTSAVAYLLDPAIKQLFIEQKKTYVYIIPALIILAFALKGSSLYFAKVIMINVSEDVRKDIQTDMFSSLIKADTQLVDNKHSGKFIGNLTNDVNMIVALVSTVILNLFITKKFKLNIFKKYPLDEIVKAHQDLENRKILGPAVIIP